MTLKSKKIIQTIVVGAIGALSVIAAIIVFTEPAQAAVPPDWCTRRGNALRTAIEFGAQDCANNPQGCQQFCGLECHFCATGACGDFGFDDKPTCIPPTPISCLQRINPAIDTLCRDPLNQDRCELHCEMGRLHDCTYTEFGNGGPACSSPEELCVIKNGFLAESIQEGVLDCDNDRQACQTFCKPQCNFSSEGGPHCTLDNAFVEEQDKKEVCEDQIKDFPCRPNADETTAAICRGKCQENAQCGYDGRVGKCLPRSDQAFDISNDGKPVISNDNKEDEIKILTSEELEAGLSSRYQVPKSGPLAAIPCAVKGTCNNVNDLVQVAVAGAQFLFSLIGAIAFVMFIAGGFTMILSFGSAERFKKGQQILVAAVAGLLVSLSAYVLVEFILDAIGLSGYFKN